MAIAAASFLIWLATVGRPTPIVLPDNIAYWGTLVALAWGVVIPSLYTGDP